MGGAIVDTNYSVEGRKPSGRGQNEEEQTSVARDLNGSTQEWEWKHYSDQKWNI